MICVKSTFLTSLVIGEYGRELPHLLCNWGVRHFSRLAFWLAKCSSLLFVRPNYESVKVCIHPILFLFKIEKLPFDEPPLGGHVESFQSVAPPCPNFLSKTTEPNSLKRMYIYP